MQLYTKDGTPATARDLRKAVFDITSNNADEVCWDVVAEMNDVARSTLYFVGGWETVNIILDTIPLLNKEQQESIAKSLMPVTLNMELDK